MERSLVEARLKTADDEKEVLNKNGYAKENKIVYILLHCLVPILIGGLCFYYYFIAVDWVDKHKNQKNTYG